MGSVVLSQWRSLHQDIPLSSSPDLCNACNAMLYEMQCSRVGMQVTARHATNSHAAQSATLSLLTEYDKSERFLQGVTCMIITHPHCCTASHFPPKRKEMGRRKRGWWWGQDNAADKAALLAELFLMGLAPAGQHGTHTCCPRITALQHGQLLARPPPGV